MLTAATIHNIRKYEKYIEVCAKVTMVWEAATSQSKGTGG